MPSLPQTMTAMAVDAFGGPEQLTPHTLPLATPEAGEVLLRVEAAGVGVWDSLEREGKLVYNAVKFPRILGGECAGTVAAVGDSVSRVSVGDRVYAQSFMNDKGGSYAQFVVVKESVVAQIPAGLEIVQAGGLPIAGVTALANLEAAGVKKGTDLLLWGASGGVGHVGVQLAKRLGARVLAIASGTDGVTLAKELGADEAIDGRRDDVLARGKAFAPAGFDAAVIFTPAQAMQSTLALVKRGGTIAFPNGVMPEPTAPAGVTLKKANGLADPRILEELNRLIDAGPFRVHIARTFPLQEAAAAQEAMKRHYIGKIVLTVA